MGVSLQDEQPLVKAALELFFGLDANGERRFSSDDLEQILPFILLRYAGSIDVAQLPPNVQSNLYAVLEASGALGLQSPGEIRSKIDRYYIDHPVRVDLIRSLDALIRAGLSASQQLGPAATTLIGAVSRRLPTNAAPPGSHRGALGVQLSVAKKKDPP